MENSELNQILDQLLGQPVETEWLEFKLNFHSFEEIGEDISAISNSLCIRNKDKGFIVFGVKDETLEAIGTTLSLDKKKGNEPIDAWLARMLSPSIDFQFYQFQYSNEKNILLIEITSANNSPVRFLNEAYIRIGSTTKKLKSYPEKERKIWMNGEKLQFEQGVAKTNLNGQDVIDLLDTQAYFDLLNTPYPSKRSEVLDSLSKEGLISVNNGAYSILNLGAILFAKELHSFDSLYRKTSRVIVYKGKNKLHTLKDKEGVRGYAVGFSGLVGWVSGQLPENEVISNALSAQIKMYPEIALRELVANALLHQDFEEKGNVTIEIYSDRIEITNPGQPLVSLDRMIDENKSRNEKLAYLMRKVGICEEKGKGIDQVIHECEIFQLPAPQWVKKENVFVAKLFSYKTFNNMTKSDKIRACFQHCALKYVMNEKMSNSSLRKRFKIPDSNSAIVSRIIKDTLDTNMIKKEDPNAGYKYVRYLPYFA